MRKGGAEPDIPLEAVQSLLTRVIWQAVADLSVEAYRGEPFGIGVVGHGVWNCG